MSNAGDVNGDGRPDLVIGAPHQTEGGGPGAAYIVFNDGQRADIDLADISQQGFAVTGVKNDQLGRSVADAGDVNGDGLDDVIVGAPTGNPEGRVAAGQAFVVFGKADHTPVETADLGPAGFRIDGAQAAFANNQGNTGRSVSGAGDVNGDGLDDVVIAAPQDYDPRYEWKISSGAVFVVFGSRSPERVDLAQLGDRGFRIQGHSGGSFGGSFYSPRGVAGPGDIDGDGLADIVIGQPGYGAGTAWVVFGSHSTEPVDTMTLGDRGYEIQGARDSYEQGKGIEPGGQLGWSVAGVGDVNADGRPDVAVGAANEGAAYVIFGGPSRSAVDTAALGVRGFRIGSNPPVTLYGAAVAGAGDANGDGRADVLVGGPGGAELIWGKADSGEINVLALDPSQGFSISGRGTDIDGAGDWDGDGTADVVGGDALASSRGRSGDGGVALATDWPVLVHGRCANLTAGGGVGDWFTGTPEGDSIFGYGGDDRITGGASRDCISGGPGRDILEGGEARDRLKGGRGQDRLHGGAENDVLDGGSGNDRPTDGFPYFGGLYGDAGNDVLRGGPGRDLLDGGPGADRLDCGPGRDRALPDRRDVLVGCEIVRKR